MKIVISNTTHTGRNADKRNYRVLFVNDASAKAENTSVESQVTNGFFNFVSRFEWILKTISNGLRRKTNSIWKIGKHL